MKLSIIVPVYNEKVTILDCVERIRSVILPRGFEKEIIVVDDGSTDGTSGLLGRLESTCKVLRHERNRGKGAAIRTALPHVTGEYVVTQDADLEVDPNDLAKMLSKMLDENLTVLYGSRWIGKERKSYSSFSFYFGNILLSAVTNILYGQKITDEPTCYKMFRTGFLRSLPLKCKRFEYCPEVTALTALHGIRIKEIPISYKSRNISEGKKIRWHDGLSALKTLIVYRFKKNIFFYIFILALVVRLALFFFNLHGVGGDLITVIHGQDGYYDVSRNLFLGNGFSINPTPPYFDYSYGVPGYPYFLYFLLWITGGSYAFTVAIQILLGSFIPVIGMYITRYLVQYKRASLVVGILLALAPYQILFSFIFYTEALFTALFGIFLILFFKFLKNPSLRLTVWSAMFLGLATLTKPTVQYYVIIVPIFIFWHFRKEITKNLFKKVACFIFLFFLVLSPWLYRNYKTFDMINLSAQMPFNLYEVLLPSVLSIANHTSFATEQDKLPRKAADIFFNTPKSVSSEAINEIKRHPVALIELSVLNGFTFFTHDGMLTFLQASGIQPVSYLPKPAIVMFLTEPWQLAKAIWLQLHTAMALVFFARLFWISVTILFFLGIYHLWRSKLFTSQVSFAVITVLYFMLTTMINGLTVNARFRMPVEPLFFAIAYAGFVFLYQIFKRRFVVDNIKN